jgi:hypothetical protein
LSVVRSRAHQVNDNIVMSGGKLPHQSAYPSLARGNGYLNVFQLRHALKNSPSGLFGSRSSAATLLPLATSSATVHIAAVVLPEPPLTCAKVIIAIGQSPTSLKPRNPDSPIQRNHDSREILFHSKTPWRAQDSAVGSGTVARRPGGRHAFQSEQWTGSPESKKTGILVTP